MTGSLIATDVAFWPLLLPIHGILLTFLFTLEHECTHKTPFASAPLNEWVGRLCGLILMLPFGWFRYFHLAHHKWTNIDGKDPELTAEKPKTQRDWLIHVSGLPYWSGMFGTLIRLATRREPSTLPAQVRPDADAARGMGDSGHLPVCPYIYPPVPFMGLDHSIDIGPTLPAALPSGRTRRLSARREYAGKYPHDLHNGDGSVSCMEHALPCRTPCLSERAFPRPARVSRHTAPTSQGNRRGLRRLHPGLPFSSQVAATGSTPWPPTRASVSDTGTDLRTGP